MTKPHKFPHGLNERIKESIGVDMNTMTAKEQDEILLMARALIGAHNAPGSALGKAVAPILNTVEISEATLARAARKS